MVNISKFKKIIQFSLPRLLHSPSFLLIYTTVYFQKNYSNNAQFYTKSDILKMISEGKSILRLGDGESMILSGVSISYQNYNRKLCNELKSCIKLYKESSPYILAIPERYVNQTNDHLRLISTEEFNALHAWLPFKIWFRKIFPKKILYADSHVFYDKYFFDKITPHLLSKKLIIIITTQTTINKQKFRIEKQFREVSWIVAKAPNPYEWYNNYIKEVNTVLERKLFDKKDVIVLVSAGPASKPLVQYFSGQGLQSVDIGHGFEYLGDLTILEKQIV